MLRHLPRREVDRLKAIADRQGWEQVKQMTREEEQLREFEADDAEIID